MLHGGTEMDAMDGHVTGATTLGFVFAGNVSDSVALFTKSLGKYGQV